MQPSLYAPLVDVTRAQMGFGRVGLRVLNRELSSKDNLIQLQAIHTILDQVQISESAIFLINLNIVYRLIEIIHDRDPIVREKVCMILTHLAGYYQGRERIMSRPIVFENLMHLIMRDRKEIRYAAAYTLMTLAKDRCSCETIMQTDNIVENLLKMVKDDHTGIVLLHLKTLSKLCEWDPEPALKANAFQIMLALFRNHDKRVAAKAMDCMAQLCKHNVGKRLADMYDMTHHLFKHYLMSPNISVVISVTGLMAYTTQTTRSKWRAKEFSSSLTKRLVSLCIGHNLPLLQMRCMQVLINLCDCPDIRYHMKKHWEKRVKAFKIRTHEMWDGTSEITSYGLETGHNYRTMCIEGVETIKNEYGDNANVINVHSYLRTVNEYKEHLIRAINFLPHKH
ncbi:radial spoke head 14 homolog isoform X2 [Anticarsia gemmatalis]